MTSLDTFKCRRVLYAAGRPYVYFSLAEAEKNGLEGISHLPGCLKVVLENLLRHEDGRTVKAFDIVAFADWLTHGSSGHEIAFYPARVLTQDLAGVPVLADLAAMRDVAVLHGVDPRMINPKIPVDLIVDHSITVDDFGTPSAYKRNIINEYHRNIERYKFLRWGQQAFSNLRIVPPGVGICHQVNLELLSQVVWTADDDDGLRHAYPDTLVGTDSHTPMVNAMTVLGWGVGGIEAEAAMLGQPISMEIPDVVGFRLTGRLPEGATATDLVLTITEMLRRHGVVGKFVEFYGAGLSSLSLEDRATIANMAPEYGATCGFFPTDGETLTYLRATNRAPERIALVEAYSKAQGIWRYDGMPDPRFTSTLALDLGDITPSLAGPRRPQDRLDLSQGGTAFRKVLLDKRGADTLATVQIKLDNNIPVALRDGHIVIAAITSCTNTSNPSVMIGAGLLAKKAHEKGLTTKPWVKTSLAPGSQVVTAYLQKAGLQKYLDALGFNLVGYGCTTCMGNSGPLPKAITEAIQASAMMVCSVLSGNRNFEGRIHPDAAANFLASPPLVVAYALAGTMAMDITRDPLGEDVDGNPVYLRDIWPTSQEIAEVTRQSLDTRLFQKHYADVFSGDDDWNAVKVEGEETYNWSFASTYIRKPPFFKDMALELSTVPDVEKARILGLFLDSITTDHISPVGPIKSNGPAGIYLTSHQVAPSDFNSYGARRGNHEVMIRGALSNSKLQNQMVPGVEGGFTIHHPSGQRMPIYDAAERYRAENTPLVILAGREYGTGSSRDWAAKAPFLMGVRAVVAESFERIHRSNLVGMGVLPVIFEPGTSWQSLSITGNEQISITGLADLSPRKVLEMTVAFADGRVKAIPVIAQIYTLDELDYFRNGGILQYVMRSSIEQVNISGAVPKILS